MLVARVPAVAVEMAFSFLVQQHRTIRKISINQDLDTPTLQERTLQDTHSCLNLHLHVNIQ
jgi:hypothetical protein